MTGERVERRLAAVLAADVAGYSRLMGANEEGTLVQLKTVRKALVDPTIAKHRGRIVKTTGDGMLVEFASAVDAARCGVEVQRAMAAQNTDVPQDVRIEFRIGIHVGDIIIDDNDIFGDGVNIAARLEGIAEPGGVCISDDTQRQVRGKVDFAFEDLGLQILKNIADPMRAWRMQLGGESAVKARSTPLLALPDKPSIAVLPFQNMSGDPEQEYFADGIVEDIITALSRFKSLFVIARNSSFTYKGKAVDIKQVGRELGVRYVLEGSVRKAGGRVRITGQLIEASTGSHLWADRFDGDLQDVFDLQDQVTTSVVGELVTQVQDAEMQRARLKPTSNLDAYDCYLRGLAHVYKWGRSDVEAALGYFLQAVERENEFALAYACAAQIYTLRKQNRWMIDIPQESSDAVRLARHAIEKGKTDDLALSMGGFVLAYIAGELELAIECISRGLSMNANLAIGWHFSGWVHMYLGKHQIALQHQQQAVRLSPRDPNMMQFKLATAFAHLFTGQYEQALHLVEGIAGEFPTFVPAWRVMAVSRALRGETMLAGQAVQKAMELDPSQRVTMLASQLPLRRPEDRECWREGLLRAGFPP